MQSEWTENIIVFVVSYPEKLDKIFFQSVNHSRIYWKARLNQYVYTHLNSS